MGKLICTICGYTYDESNDSGTKWEDVPADWNCPICGADKSEFQDQKAEETTTAIVHEDEELTTYELSFGGMSALFSNLSKGYEKQYKLEEANLFSQLSEYYNSISELEDNNQLTALDDLTKQNLTVEYSQAKAISTKNSDRGALRALVWGEKVTQILSSILTRYDKQKEELLKNKKIFVCEICGFIFIGDEKPEICPICKVPNIKIREIQKEAI